MRKCFFVASLLLLTSSCFGQVFLSKSAGLDGYHCGVSQTTAKNPAWCACYSAYLHASCELSGGSVESCADEAIRSIINEFGGPDVICMMIPNPDLTPDMCKDTLTYYLAEC